MDIEGSAVDWPGCGTVAGGSTDGELVTAGWPPVAVPGTVTTVVGGAPVSAGAPGTVTGASVVSGRVVATGAAALGAVVATDSLLFVAPFVGRGGLPLRARPTMMRPQTITATAHGAERVQARRPAQARRGSGRG